eukprot:5455849-Pyramimonas_sp.AAC.1
MAFGEIDCREGILLSVNRDRYKDIQEGIQVTVGIYVKKRKNNITSFYGSSCANNGINWKIVFTYEPKIMLTSSQKQLLLARTTHHPGHCCYFLILRTLTRRWGSTRASGVRKVLAGELNSRVMKWLNKGLT